MASFTVEAFSLDRCESCDYKELKNGLGPLSS